MYVSTLVFICTICMPGDLRGQKRVLDPGTRVVNGCESPCGYWGLNLGPLQEQVLTAEPSL